MSLLRDPARLLDLDIPLDLPGIWMKHEECETTIACET